MLRLNLGSGAERYDGWSSLDTNKDFHPDYLADCRKIPLDDNTVDEIFASHILEHTTFKEDALAEWCRVLKTGGKITVCVPDLMQMLAHYRAGIIPLDNFYASIYGNQITGDTRPGMEHFQVFTVDMLVERMRTHFRDVKQASEGMPRPGYFGEAIAQGWKA